MRGETWRSCIQPKLTLCDVLMMERPCACPSHALAPPTLLLHPSNSKSLFATSDLLSTENRHHFFPSTFWAVPFASASFAAALACTDTSDRELGQGCGEAMEMKEVRMGYVRRF